MRQNDHLIVIYGGYLFKKKGLLYVPTNCFEVVQNQSNGTILFCGTFTNTSKAREKDISEPALENILGYKLPVLRTQPQQQLLCNMEDGSIEPVAPVLRRLLISCPRPFVKCGP
jgi:hypothetical protein